MAAKTRKISTLVEQQLPGFIASEYENFSKFVEKYYEQLELRGQPLDIISNITKYRDIDFYEENLLKQNTTLASNITDTSSTIVVDDASSFPEENGYIKIGNEICFYKERTNTTFLEVSRGVSGNTTLGDLYSSTEFVTTNAASHYTGDTVHNISNLFLYAFVKNFEEEYLGAFPEKYLKGEIDKRTLIKNISKFYRAKGTDRSIKFIFNSLVSRIPGDSPEVYNPKDFTLKASTSDWVANYSIKARVLSGNAEDMVGNIMVQNYGATQYASATVDNIIPQGENIFEIVLDPTTVNGTFDVAAKTKLTKLLDASAEKGDRINVISTQGFAQSGEIRIGNEVIKYSDKTVNQFIISERTAPINHASNSDVFNYYSVSCNGVEIVSLGVLYNLNVESPAPFSEEGDIVQISDAGFESIHPVIYNKSTTAVRWILSNIAKPPVCTLNQEIDAAISDLSADVSAIFEDDQYFYICSSGFPSYNILKATTPNIPEDQKNLRLIRKYPVNTTETYKTGSRDVGIFLDGTLAFGYKDTSVVKFGTLEKISLTKRGGGYKFPPYVLINNKPGLAKANLAGDVVESIDILNDVITYNTPPSVEITAGRNGAVDAVVTSGRVTSLVIVNPGEYYSSAPLIRISDLAGRGKFAEFTAVVANGKIVNFEKINEGKFYTQENIRVEVIEDGRTNKAQAVASITEWNFNRFKNLQSQLDENFGFIFESYNSIGSVDKSYGYGILANPRKLRVKLNDNLSSTFLEPQNKTHSPIIGFAYDGNPIYGPFGYSNPKDPTSPIVRLQSGYSLKASREGGPSTVQYALGTFIQDYDWTPSIETGRTKLDKNNGRYCVTPDYPEGTYAYFLTIDQNNTPVFPYIIGDNYYSLPVDSNYNSEISQNDIPKNVKRLRNELLENNGTNSYAIIERTTSGSVDSVYIESSHNTFSVGSSLFVNDANTGGNGAEGQVSSIKGKEVLSIESKDTKAVLIKTLQTSYFFAGDTLTQQGTSASGEIIGDVIDDNIIVLRNVSGEFNLVNPVSSTINVINIILDRNATYTVGSTIFLTDGDSAPIAAGILLEGTANQNRIKLKVTQGEFALYDGFFLKSSNLADTAGAIPLTISSQSLDISIAEINSNICITETAENHDLRQNDIVEIDINPDDNTTETTYYVRKKYIQEVYTKTPTFSARLTDTGIGRYDVLNTGVDYLDGVYTDVELILSDSTKARGETGLPGDPGNARANITVQSYYSQDKYYGEITNVGSGYIPGEYTDVPVTGGSGADATANIVVTGTYDQPINLVDGGSGYTPNTTLFFIAANAITETFEFTLNGSGEFIVDGVLNKSLQFTRGNTYRFDYRDSSLDTSPPTLINIFALNPQSGQIEAYNENYVNVVYRVASESALGYVDIAITPETPIGYQLVYFNQSTGTQGLITIQDGAIGSYGSGMYIVAETDGDGVVNNVFEGQRGKNYNPGDVLSATEFDVTVGSGLTAQVSNPIYYGKITSFEFSDLGNKGYRKNDYISVDTAAIGGEGEQFEFAINKVELAGYGTVVDVEIINKGYGYQKFDTLTVNDADLNRLVSTVSSQRLQISVDHVGLSREQNVVQMNSVAGISVDDTLLIGSEEIKILSIDENNKTVTVERSAQTDYFNGALVNAKKVAYRFEVGTQIGDTPSSPYVESYNPETNLLTLAFDYGVVPSGLTRANTFYDDSSPQKLVALSRADSPKSILEFSLNNVTFDVNPRIEVQKYYKYTFDTSHPSMADTFLNFSPSLKYNIETPEKIVSTVAPGNSGSFVSIKLGFGPTISSNTFETKKPVNYSNYYYFITASTDIDTYGATLQVVDDPLAGRKTVVYTTNNKFVYELSKTPQYDGSGLIKYTTTSSSAVGEIHLANITNTGRDYKRVPTVTGVFPSQRNKALFEVNYNSRSQFIESVTLIDGGKNYSKPKVVITDGDGVGAEFELVVLDGVIKKILVTNYGKNYTYAPTIDIIETDAKIYFGSSDIGTPKYVRIVNNGRDFNTDKTLYSEFKSHTAFLVKESVADAFAIGEQVIQLSGNSVVASGYVSKKGWRKGSNILRLEKVSGLFDQSLPLIGKTKNNTAKILATLNTIFAPDIRSAFDNMGQYVSDKGKIGIASQKITDSYFYQDYSYVIKSKTPIDIWRDLIKDTVHPAGFRVFGEVSINSTGNITMPFEPSSDTFESIQFIDLGSKIISVESTKQQLTETVINVDALNVERGIGQISVDTFNYSETIAGELILSAPFDGYFDPNTGQRVGTTTFTLIDTETNSAFTPYNEQQLILTLDGILQEPGVAFTVSGSQITFTEAPFGDNVYEGQNVTGQRFYCKYLTFKLDSLNNRHFKKVKSLEFDGSTRIFDLFYEDGTPVKTDYNENLLVTLNAVVQKSKYAPFDYAEFFTFTGENNLFIVSDLYLSDDFYVGQTLPSGQESSGFYNQVISDENLIQVEKDFKPSKNAYLILRSSNASLPDKIIFSEAPINHEDLLENPEAQLDGAEKNFIYNVGSYLRLTIDKKVVEYRKTGPFLIIDEKDNTVKKIDDSRYALVFIDGVLQVEGESYTINGPIINFKSPLNYNITESGERTIQDVSIILLYGRDIEQSLTAYNFERDAYYNRITYNVSGSSYPQFLEWYGNNGVSTDVFVYQLKTEVNTFPVYSEIDTTNGDSIYEFGAGTAIAPNGTGTGSLGGFAIGPHLKFGNVPGDVGGLRYCILNPVDTRNIITMSFLAIRGNGTNGGETPDIAGEEELRLQYQTGNDIPDPDAWIDYRVIISTRDNLDGVGTLINYEYVLPPDAKDEKTYFRIYQKGNSGVNYDHYGITSVKFYELQSEVISPERNINVLGLLKSFRPNQNGWEFILSSSTNSVYNDEQNLIFSTKRGLKDNSDLTLPTSGLVTTNYDLVNEDNERMMIRSGSRYHFGSEIHDKAWFEQKKMLLNLSPGDKIQIDGESEFREINRISNIVKTKDYRDYQFVSNDIYSKIFATNYNKLTRGEGLSVTATVERGKVTKLNWNRRELDLYFKNNVLLQPTAYQYFTPPVLQFIPTDGSGGGARAEVIVYNGSVVDIVLLDGGSGYTSEPNVIVSRGYNIVKEPSRKIDSLTVLNINLTTEPDKLISASVVSYIDIIAGGTGIAGLTVIIPVNQIETDRNVTTIVEPGVKDASLTENTVTKLSIIDYGGKDDVKYLDSISSVQFEYTSIIDVPLEIVTSSTVTTVQNVYREITTTILSEANEALVKNALNSVNDIGTYLDAPMSLTDTIVYVPDTRRFPTFSKLLIGKEIVSYDGKQQDRFLNVTRGLSGTEITTHQAGQYIRHLPDLVSVVSGGAISVTSEIVVSDNQTLITSESLRIYSSSEQQVQSTTIQNSYNQITVINKYNTSVSEIDVSTSIMPIPPASKVILETLNTVLQVSVTHAAIESTIDVKVAKNADVLIYYNMGTLDFFEEPVALENPILTRLGYLSLDNPNDVLLRSGSTITVLNNNVSRDEFYEGYSLGVAGPTMGSFDNNIFIDSGLFGGGITIEEFGLRYPSLIISDFSTKSLSNWTSNGEYFNFVTPCVVNPMTIVQNFAGGAIFVAAGSIDNFPEQGTLFMGYDSPGSPSTKVTYNGKLPNAFINTTIIGGSAPTPGMIIKHIE